jgi:hypothetical protein
MIASMAAAASPIDSAEIGAVSIKAYILAICIEIADPGSISIRGGKRVYRYIPSLG